MDNPFELGESDHIVDFAVAEFSLFRFVRVETGSQQDGADFEVKVFGFLRKIDSAANFFTGAATGTVFYVDGRQLRIFTGIIMVNGFPLCYVEIEFIGYFHRTDFDGFL